MNTLSTPAPFHILLLAPEIPANTGNIARTCLATGAHLHLVKPLGFSIDDRTLLRAGLDYWKEVHVTVWERFEDYLASQPPGARNFYLTTKTQKPYYSVGFQPGDTLIFGRETKGLPESLLAAHPEECLTIPMSNQTRSLNLSVSVGIVLYEAIRQQRSL